MKSCSKHEDFHWKKIIITKNSRWWENSLSAIWIFLVSWLFELYVFFDYELWCIFFCVSYFWIVICNVAILNEKLQECIHFNHFFVRGIFSEYFSWICTKIYFNFVYFWRNRKTKNSSVSAHSILQTCFILIFISFVPFSPPIFPVVSISHSLSLSLPPHFTLCLSWVDRKNFFVESKLISRANPKPEMKWLHVNVIP